jgi:hypothetical protein
MSAIKRFFSSHKNSSSSKVHHPQNHENKSSVIEKVPVINEQEEVKENTSPVAELPLKYLIQIEFKISFCFFHMKIRDCSIATIRNG